MVALEDVYSKVAKVIEYPPGDYQEDEDEGDGLYRTLLDAKWYEQEGAGLNDCYNSVNLLDCF